MIKIYIDKKIFFVESSCNLLQACLSVGINIPFFCWHPALGSIGSCRQCAVKVYQNDDDQIGMIVMACMLSVKQDMRISTTHSDVINFQKNITELMMLNHPHDCPVCAEGGSCHLQDMTVLNKHHIRRYRFEKRVYNNQYLGPFISHVMNRCITCYRCTRYYNDYAGGKDFGVYGSNNKIYFGRFENGILESEYSGNLIDICPTGVFTDKSNIDDFYRKWDLQYSPSVCHNCSIGCNISLGERLGKLCRVDNRYNKHLNRYFLCDLGKFGCNYVNFTVTSKPFKLKNNITKFLNYSEAINLISNVLQDSSNRVLGIGSSRASIESNMALFNLVGENNFSNGVLPELNQCTNLIADIIKRGGLHTPSISEIEQYDVILIIAEDITQTAALAALSVRQAVKGVYSSISDEHNIPIWHINAIKNIAQNKKNLLFIINGSETKLDDISKISYHGSIQKQLQFSTAILDCINNNTQYVQDNHQDIFDQVNLIAKALCNSKKPLIISGTSYYHTEFIKISFNIAKSLQTKGLPVGLALFPPSANSIGVSLIPNISLNIMFDIIHSEKIDVLIILENDLYRLYEANFIDNILKNINTVIVIDHQNNRMTKNAHIFLPCTNFFESSGSIVNYEARLQRFFRTHNPNFYNKKIYKLDSWRWIYAIKHNINSFMSIQLFTLDKMMKLCSLWNSIFKKLKDSAQSADFKIHGQKIARSSLRFSGRSSMFANKNVHEPVSPIDPDSMFSFSMEGNQQTENNFSHAPFLWSPNWNSNQSLHKSSNRLNNQFIHLYEGILLFKDYKEKILSNFDIKRFNKNVAQDSLYFRIIPYYKLLGSEEMSQNYFVKIMKINVIYVRMNDSDAFRLKINNGDILQFQVNNLFFRFPVFLSKQINVFHIGLPIGCGKLPAIFFNKVATNLTKYNK
ncbi:NADH-quinone oxidoreductase subunit G [Buchnera aphidicola (Cinara kochiana kochiana)]|uniref:NADH-quinone oxidoreductase subunit G n=1 Tax=Buchnera aphidicola (Cinara kochiana kochiana) TaxID=2518976 RepID=A0A451D5G3_9GAMM|nr:NADH-quinone oxidoreductase subunit NuoG [Buchnera aphidicola]VFP81027.1 NADH-quinone oxidoreductase subunit G [Buchnera aphidicola (Cinara kochiana kochiana)]